MSKNQVPLSELAFDSARINWVSENVVKIQRFIGRKENRCYYYFETSDGFFMHTIEGIVSESFLRECIDRVMERHDKWEAEQ